MTTKETEHILMKLENGILWFHYKPGSIDIDEAKQVVQDRVEFTQGEILPVLIVDDGVTKMSKTARDYLSSKAGTQNISAAAVVITSPFSKLIINFILKINRPDIPVRIFTKEDEALVWLQRLKS